MKKKLSVWTKENNIPYYKAWRQIKNGTFPFEYEVTDTNRILVIDKDGNFNYGALYEYLCNAQYTAQVLSKSDKDLEKVVDDILTIREVVGEKLLNYHFNKANSINNG
jgi:hypothetical protein